MCSLFDPVAYQLISDEDKMSAKKFLQAEVQKMKKNSPIDDPAQHSVPNSPSSPSTANQSTTKKSTTANRLKSFREKGGLVDHSSMSTTASAKSLTLRQEFAQLEAFDKEDHTFASFWRKHSSALPILSRMARQFGPIPATSVPSESAFSVAGYVARKTRSSLSAKNLKYSMFLKDKL